MTPDELAALSAEIKNDPSARGYAAHLPDDPQRVIDILSATTCTMFKSRYVTARTILAECADGAEILDTLQSIGQNVSPVKWMMVFLQQDSGMDAGHPRTVANIDNLVTNGLLSASFAGQIKSMITQPANRAEFIGLSSTPTARDVLDAWEVQ